jgi:hypothetical protein
LITGVGPLRLTLYNTGARGIRHFFGDPVMAGAFGSLLARFPCPISRARTVACALASRPPRVARPREFGRIDAPTVPRGTSLLATVAAAN